MEGAQNKREFSRGEFRAGNRHIAKPQRGKVVAGSIGQLRTHLIVQHPVKHLRECPAIHSQSPGEVCQAAFRGSSSHRGLVAGGFRGGALLPGDPKREPQGGNSIPLRHLVPEFPPHLQRSQSQVKVLHLSHIPFPGKRQLPQVITIMGQYKFCQFHIAKIRNILYICKL